jgi:hypothetical protein
MELLREVGGADANTLIHYRVRGLLEGERFFRMGPTLNAPILHCHAGFLLEIVSGVSCRLLKHLVYSLTLVI